MSAIYSLENEAFAALVKYGGIVLLKLVAMTPVTVGYRFANNSVISEEDAVMRVGNNKEKIKRLLEPKREVERVGCLLHCDFVVAVIKCKLSRQERHI